MKSKRTQVDRSAATRSALIDAARPLFAERGYADVGTDELARAAGVTRGALYHQFGGKEGLFDAVFETVEAEVSDAIALLLADVADQGAVGALLAGVDAWLSACANPEVHQIVLIDAPSVVGYGRWREIGQRYGIGLVEVALAGAMAEGAILQSPTRPLAHVLTGALNEAALYVARADDPATATDEVRTSLQLLLAGLTTPP